MTVFHLARSLLQTSNSYDDEDAEQHGEDGLANYDDTQALRIISIFAILMAGFLGGLPPLFMKIFRDPKSTLIKLVRAFAAGVILALALVHIIPEAVEEMAGLSGIEYPLGGTCVLGGVVLMVMLEHAAHIVNTTSDAAGTDRTAVASGPRIATVHAHCGSSKIRKGATSDCLLIGGDSSTMEAPLKGAGSQQSTMVTVETGGEAAAAGGAGSGMGHSHTCVSHGSASNWLAAGTMEVLGGLRLKIVAYLFELGCIFHSFIIGVSLGVNQTDLTEIRSLLIALSFHQWLEGISLASVVLRGGFSRGMGALMILTYSLTCPIGIAIGMAIAKAYDGESERARGVQGAFNGVSGGMLLYIALVQLVAEDMGRLVPGRDSAGARLSCFAALCAGAGCMCLLAVWA